MKRLHRIHTVLSSRRAIAYAVLFTAIALLLFSPLTRTLPFRSFLAALTQDLLLSDVNPHRASLGVAPLRVNPLLNEAARMKAEDMFARQYFSHYGPSGETPWVWFDRVGYRYAAAGENLAIDFSDADALVAAWLASPTHRKNIENGVFTDIGLGIADGVFEGRQTTIVVMFLGREAATTVAASIVQPPAQGEVEGTPSQSLPEPSAPVAQPPQEAPTASVSPPVQEPSVTSLRVAPSGEGSVAAPLVVSAVPSDEPLIVRTGEISFAQRNEAIPNPFVAKAVLFLFVQAASSLRLILSLVFVVSLAVHVVLYLQPSHRARVRLLPSGVMLALLAVLWLPELLG